MISGILAKKCVRNRALSAEIAYTCADTCTVSLLAGWSRMLTAEAFRAWCEHLQLSQDTADRIAAIRASPPVCQATGRAGNVAGGVLRSIISLAGDFSLK